MEKWTLFGAGNFTEDIICAIEAKGDVVVQVVINQEISSEMTNYLEKNNIEITHFETFNPYADQYFFGFVSANKEGFLNDLIKHNLKFSNLIHPASVLPPRTILGEGNFIGAGSVIGAGTSFGNFNFVNRLASVGHHNCIGNFNHFGPGSTVSGKCQIGDKNFFGAGSIVKDGINIGNEITLGAGGVAVKDLSDPGIYIGMPAKLLNKKT